MKWIRALLRATGIYLCTLGGIEGVYRQPTRLGTEAYWARALRPVPGSVRLRQEGMQRLLRPYLHRRNGGRDLGIRAGIGERTACRLLEFAEKGPEAHRQLFYIGTIYQLCCKLHVLPSAVLDLRERN